jgi:glycosyltransferase involved in cell wall biosynthesis
MLARLVETADSSEFEHVVIPLLEGGPVTDRVRAAGALAAPLRVQGPANLVTAPVRLASRLAKLRPDIVQGWLLQGNLAASIGAGLGRLQAPVLWNVRWTLYDIESERPATRALLRLSGRLSRHPRFIVYNSQAAVAQHAVIGFPPERARVIPNGFDTKRFRPDVDARSAIRQELGIAPERVVVGMVARYHEMKDHAMSLRAAARVVERRPDALFVYAGRGVDAENERLMGLISDLGLDRHVRLLGERQDVPRLYASFDVYWMSSVARGIAEGFPNVVAEAMACGVPCVATDNGDAAAIIGATGRIVPSRDWRAFGDATVDLLTAGPEALQELGRQARARIERDYAQSAVTDAYHALYVEVLTEQREASASS